MKEYDVGIKHEKSALENFVDKYVIDEESGVMPFYYFKEKNPEYNNIIFRNLFVFCFVLFFLLLIGPNFISFNVQDSE